MKLKCKSSYFQYDYYYDQISNPIIHKDRWYEVDMDTRCGYMLITLENGKNEEVPKTHFEILFYDINESREHNIDIILKNKYELQQKHR